MNLLNAELNLFCHLLALLGAHPILHVSRIRVNEYKPCRLFRNSKIGIELEVIIYNFKVFINTD